MKNLSLVIFVFMLSSCVAIHDNQASQNSTTTTSDVGYVSSGPIYTNYPYYYPHNVIVNKK